jgi:hypothetical protein
MGRCVRASPGVGLGDLCTLGLLKVTTSSFVLEVTTALLILKVTTDFSVFKVIATMLVFKVTSSFVGCVSSLCRSKSHSHSG